MKILNNYGSYNSDNLFVFVIRIHFLSVYPENKGE